MAKTFCPSGIREIMQKLDDRLLRMILKANNLLVANAGVDQIYQHYLENFGNDAWYECCTRLYDIDLVAYYNADEGMSLRDYLAGEGRYEEFMAATTHGGRSVHDYVAWISCNMNEHWSILVNEANVNQVEAGGRRHYIERLNEDDRKEDEDALGEVMSERRQSEFKKVFSKYMTDNRSKVVNVHIETNPFKDLDRYVVYFDPFPRKNSQFSEGKMVQHETKEVEYITIVHFKDERFPYITIRGKTISAEHEPEIAARFIRWILGGKPGSRPIFRYDMTKFNQRHFQFADIDDDDLDTYRILAANILITNADRSVDTICIKSSNKNVYDLSSAFLESRQINQKCCRYTEVRVMVSIFDGEQGALQDRMFDKPEDRRKKVSYEVKITGGERQILKCKNKAHKAIIERILDKWDIKDLNKNVQV